MKVHMKRIVAVLCVVLFAVSIPCMSASAALSDVDFTINVETDKEYSSGDTVDAKLEIKTQTENGYVEMSMIMRYNADTLTYSSTIEDLDGFTVVNDADTGQLNIYYSSPDGNRSPIDTYTLMIRFAVKTGVASGKYLLELDVDKADVYGLDANGNKEAGILTVSEARDKELTIIETNTDGVTANVGDGTDYPGYFTTPSATQSTEPKGGGCVNFGSVLLFIIGAVVIFGAGFFVGFYLAQKRMNEEGGYGFGVAAAPSSGRSARSFSRSSDRSDDNDSYDDDHSGESIYDVLDSERRSQRSAPRRPISFEQDEDDSFVDTGYFGKAASTHIGDASREVPTFEDDDDDDEGFPDRFIPRSSQSSGGSGIGSSNDSFGDFDGLLGAKTRRTQSDDGYGAFTIDDDDPENDYPFSDRRKYR